MELHLEVVRRLKAAGHRAFLVGGCVRDLLLHIVPKDFDIATSATPDQVQRLFPGSNLVGAHFGVVLVRAGENQVEVATFRSDSEYEDGRRPVSVKFESDPREDVRRRDFTINALLMDPETNEVLDYTGGRADLEAGVVRAIGEPEKRFREDHLRLLRAVRFAARFGFTIEPETFGAIRSLAHLAGDVAAERVRDEISRILTEGNARRGFELLDETGLLERVLPEIAAMKGVQQPPEFHPEGDVWVHTMKMLEGVGGNLTLALGVLLHDVGKPVTFRVAERIRFDGHVEAGVQIARRILTRLRYPNELIEKVEALVANHMRFKDVPQMRESTLKRFLRMPDFQEHLELHRLDCVSSHGFPDNYQIALNKLNERPMEVLKPLPLLRGEDLINAGYRPGPQYSRMLSIVEDAQLEGRISSREEALSLLREKFPVLQ